MVAGIEGLREATIDVAGSSIHYVEKGHGDPLVLIHGYATISTWRVWQANIDALAKGHRVLAVDLPGFGESPAPEGGVPEDFQEWFGINAQAIHGVIHGLELQHVTLCGLSAGGGASLVLATEWPEDIQRLVLVDSAGSQAADRWRTIDVPALIVWQKEDRLLPLAEHGQVLADAIPNSRLEVIEGNAAGIDPYDWHWPQALNPERFNAVVAEFLAET